MSIQRQGIKEYLQQQDVQGRIQQNLQQALSNVTVSISRAASLFGFSESQLREWEKRGLLTSERGSISQDGRGHRQYTTDELSKLAIFQELFKQGNYAPSDIPPDFDDLWEQIVSEQHHNLANSPYPVIIAGAASQTPAPMIYIDQRVERAEQEVFWRYFTAQALRLSLMLICENVPDTVAGLILPFGPDARYIGDPQALSTLGDVLVGWLDQSGSFDTFLDYAPSFEHPSDFRIEPLQAIGEKNSPLDYTMIVIQRKAQRLDLTQSLVQTVRCLLTVVYENVAQWKPAFSSGMRDYLYQATDFRGSFNPSDDVLNKLMEIVISIGGKSSNGPEQDRWKFCCLLLSEDTTIPVQKRILVVRSQSSNSPYKVGFSKVSADIPGLSLRAYQSGNIIYRSNLSHKDIIAFQEQEQTTRSAIAIPIIREDGLSIASLYVAAETPEAFPVQDQRILRLIGIMVEELLLTYQARQQVTGRRTELLDQPEIVDPSFKGFLTENDFISDLEELLATFQITNKGISTPEEALSFIAVDIDNQSTLATRYGDRVARNLSKEVGVRLRSHLNLFEKLAKKQPYHVSADRYYLLLDGISLEETRKHAEQIRIALRREYLIDAQRFSSARSKLPSTMLELSDVTARLGILSYKYKKVQEVLGRYVDAQSALAEYRSLIMDSLEAVLNLGRIEKGDRIISWDENEWGYVTWTPETS